MSHPFVFTYGLCDGPRLTCRRCVKRAIYESSKRRRTGNDITDLIKLKMLRRRSESGATLESEYSRGNRNQGSDGAWDDDELLLGEGLNEPKAYSLDIQYSNLSLTVNGGGPMVLKGVSGQIKPGRVTAIMGPSGAGKSSFLGAITGKASSYGTIAGELRINGKSRQLRNFGTECGFVPQDDTMHRDLRVREVLQYQAELRLPKSWPRIKKLEKVAYVIKLLGIPPPPSSSSPAPTPTHYHYLLFLPVLIVSRLRLLMKPRTHANSGRLPTTLCARVNVTSPNQAWRTW